MVLAHGGTIGGVLELVGVVAVVLVLLLGPVLRRQHPHGASPPHADERRPDE